MNRKKSLDHALHNEIVCKRLDKDPTNADWVITTAFYSALHYCRHKIFPFKETKNGKTIEYSCFDMYCLANGIGHAKHGAFVNLIEDKLPQIVDPYNKLKDISWNARYNEYQFDRDISNEAKKQLKFIKEYCVPNAETKEDKEN